MPHDLWSDKTASVLSILLFQIIITTSKQATSQHLTNSKKELHCFPHLLLHYHQHQCPPHPYTTQNDPTIITPRQYQLTDNKSHIDESDDTRTDHVVVGNDLGRLQGN